MRAVAAAVAAVALVLPLALSAQTAPITQRIGIVATVESVTHSQTSQVRFYLLWNREISARPIGHAYQACLGAANGGWVCTSIHTFPFGRISATGEARTFAHFSSVITGGTQSRRARRVDHPGYVGATGTLVARRIGPGTFHMTFLLRGR